MADLKNQIKRMWIKSMETVGNTASNIASNTKYKVDEMNLQNKRRDLFSNIGPQAYILWQKGEKFPDEISQMLTEIQKLDERLNDLRAERYAGKEASDLSAEEEAMPAEEGTEVPDGAETANSESDGPSVLPEQASSNDQPERAGADEPAGQEVQPAIQPLSESDIHQKIDSLFDTERNVNQLAGKVNDSLDKLDEHLKKIPTADPEKEA